MANIYEMVTDRIIAQLESGVAPWRKPWTGTISGAFNRVSKKPYSLLNQMMLMHNGEYASFKQRSDLGGKVRKGEKAEIVVFWKFIKVEEVNDKGEKEVKEIPYLRYNSVFHISQVDGVEPLAEAELHEVNSNEEADRIISEYIEREGIKFVNDEPSDEAYYSPSFDKVVVPMKEQYSETNEYYSTAFHELTHSTGHPTRLNRLTKNAGFGSENYSKEELVAEIGSATLMNIIGIESPKSFGNSASYISSWLKVLRNDSKFIVSASGRAEKAVKLIMNQQ